jgi:hypothetical protein
MGNIDMRKTIRRFLGLFIVWISFSSLSYLYSEDLSLKLGSGTIGIFYTEFAVGTLPLIFYLLFWGRKRKFQEEDGNIYFLRVTFGYLWILNAFLQMQPGMNQYFASMTIGPNVGTGGITGYFATLALSLWNLHPLVFDVAASLIQLYIGAIFLTSNGGRLYLWTQFLAILWGILIWIFGEGFGGSLERGATILTGFPGSVLVYVYASFILLLSAMNHDKMIRKSSYLFGGLVFIPAIIVQLMPTNGYFPSMSSIFMFMPSPYGVLNFANDFQYYFTQSIVWPDIVTILLILISAFGWLSGKSYGYIFSGVLAMFSWLVFQGLGILGILSTDPNTGLPLLIISIFFYLRTKNSVAIRTESAAQKNCELSQM